MKPRRWPWHWPSLWLSWPWPWLLWSIIFEFICKNTYHHHKREQPQFFLDFCSKNNFWLSNFPSPRLYYTTTDYCTVHSGKTFMIFFSHVNESELENVDFFPKHYCTAQWENILKILKILKIVFCFGKLNFLSKTFF